MWHQSRKLCPSTQSLSFHLQWKAGFPDSIGARSRIEGLSPGAGMCSLRQEIEAYVPTRYRQWIGGRWVSREGAANPERFRSGPRTMSTLAKRAARPPLYRDIPRAAQAVEPARETGRIANTRHGLDCYATERTGFQHRFGPRMWAESLRRRRC